MNLNRRRLLAGLGAALGAPLHDKGAAARLGIAIPQTLLLRADRAIE